MSTPSVLDQTPYSVHDAANDLAAENGGSSTGTEDKAKTETTATADAGTGGEVKAEDKGTEEGSDKPHKAPSEFCKLSDGLADKFPDEAKRFEDHVKGLDTLDSELHEGKADLDWLKKNRTQVETLIGLEASLGDPEKAPQTFKQIVQALKATHNWDDAKILATLGVEPKEKVDLGPEPWKADGFEYEGEWKAYLRGKEENKAALDALRTEVDPDFLKSLKSKAENDAKEANFSSWVATNAPAAIAKADKTLGGWQVTTVMASVAAKRFPEVAKTDLLAAIKAAYPDEYADHKVSLANPKKPAPEMVEGTTSKGRNTVADLGKMSPGDAARAAYEEISEAAS